MPGGGGNIFLIKRSYIFSKAEKKKHKTSFKGMDFCLSLYSKKKLLCCSSNTLVSRN